MKIWVLHEASYYDSQSVVGVTARESIANAWNSDRGDYWSEEYEVDGGEITNNWRLNKLREEGKLK
jgi:hypothetical protein